MEEKLKFSDICRLCLSDKSEGASSFFRINQSIISKFEDMTQTCLSLINLPCKICAKCRNELDNLHYYKCQLIAKQEQLQELFESRNQESFDENSQNLIIEEHLDDDSTENFIEEDEVECIAIPSFKDLPDKTNNDAIIELINEIEEKNQMILDCSKPQIALKSRRSLEPKTLAKSREDLVFEKLALKLIMQPTQSGEMSDGIILFASQSECEICGQKFSSDFSLQRHQLSSHPLKNPLSCCGQVFELMSDYKKHQVLIHPVVIECTECQKKLKSRKTYLIHKKFHHQDIERRFKCAHCDKAFNFKVHLENHDRTHSGIKPFQCLQCSASFRQKYQLTVHRRKHNGTMLKCSTCKLKFSLKSQLEKHQVQCNPENVIDFP